MTKPAATVPTIDEVIDLYHSLTEAPRFRNSGAADRERKAAETLIHDYQERTLDVIRVTLRHEPALKLDSPISSLSNLSKLTFAVDTALAIERQGKRRGPSTPEARAQAMLEDDRACFAASLHLHGDREKGTKGSVECPSWAEPQFWAWFVQRDDEEDYRSSKRMRAPYSPRITDPATRAKLGLPTLEARERAYNVSGYWEAAAKTSRGAK